MRIGTENNPIRLVNESIKRDLLIKHCRNTFSGGFDFHSLPDFGEDVYLRNVIYNPFLSGQEIKLAIYFFIELELESGKVFSTTVDSYDFVPVNTYGELFFDIETDGMRAGIAFGREDSLKSQVVFANTDGYYPSLAIAASSMGIKVTSHRLLALLRRLHDFGYITVTDITSRNTYDYENLASDTNDSRARLRHIRLCKGMQKKDLTNRWLPRKKNARKTVKK